MPPKARRKGPMFRDAHLNGELASPLIDSSYQKSWTRFQPYPTSTDALPIKPQPSRTEHAAEMLSPDAQQATASCAAFAETLETYRKAPSTPLGPSKPDAHAHVKPTSNANRNLHYPDKTAGVAPVSRSVPIRAFLADSAISRRLRTGLEGLCPVDNPTSPLKPAKKHH